MKKIVKQTTPKYGLCIDWETSGAAFGGDVSVSWKKYQGLSYGAIVFDPLTFEPVEKLYREIQFDADKYEWSMEAENIHGMSREYLAEHGVSREEAALDLGTLILEYFGPEPLIMLMGHNLIFDIGFTDQLMIDNGLPPLNQHSCRLDTAGIGMAAVGIFKSDLLFDALGFEERGKHNALADAEQTLMAVQIIRMLVNNALGKE